MNLFCGQWHCGCGVSALRNAFKQLRRVVITSVPGMIGYLSLTLHAVQRQRPCWSHGLTRCHVQQGADTYQTGICFPQNALHADEKFKHLGLGPRMSIHITPPPLNSLPLPLNPALLHLTELDSCSVKLF